MGQPITRQHPAVALRSPYAHVRALIVLAVIVLALAAAAVVALVADDEASSSGRSAVPVPERVTDSLSQQTEQRRSAVGGKAAPVGARFDGGPEEGTRGVGH